MLCTIQQFKHHVRTTFGDSEDVLVNTSDKPFQGICQGNGAGPTIWVVVSTPLIEMMRKAGHGYHFTTPLSQSTDNIVGFAFVDDTDIVEGSGTKVQLTMEEVMTSVQTAINRWEGGIKATGGAIRPEKSFLYPIDFKFRANGKCLFKTPDEIDHEITVKNADEERKILQQIAAHKGKETLGVYLAPDGNCKDAVEALRLKAESWHNNIKAGRIPPEEAW